MAYRFFILFCFVFSLICNFLNAQNISTLPSADGKTDNKEEYCQSDSLTAINSPTLPWQEQFRLAADSIISSSQLCKESQLGLLFYDLIGDSVIFACGEEQMMRPASVMKTLTAVSALKYLGTNYQYSTKLFMKGSVTDSVLNGDLYVKAGFDPRFSFSDMQAFITAIKNEKIKKINGNIYTDISIKDTCTMGQGWIWTWKNDEIPLTPLLYDGRPVFMKKLFEMLSADSIEHPGVAYNKVMPSDSLLLICECKHHIDEILLRMLKESNNNYAESLFYQMGAKKHNLFANTEKSALWVKKFIREQLGEDPERFGIYDGSGLSVYDCLTPKLVVKLLRYAWKDSSIRNHFIPALPIAGEDGTLRNRMKNQSIKDNVRAKTGTVRRVITLAGYCTAPNGNDTAFAIFHNGILSPTNTRKWDDNFLNTFCSIAYDNAK